MYAYDELHKNLNAKTIDRTADILFLISAKPLLQVHIQLIDVFKMYVLFIK